MKELRILNGLSRGSAFPLDEDKISLGASLDADIFISDPGIYERHAIFSIDPEGQEVGYRVDLFNEDASESIAETISLNVPYEIAGIWVCIAEEDTPWNMQLPEAPVDEIEEDQSHIDIPEVTAKTKSRPKIPIIPIIFVSTIFTLSFKMLAFANIDDVNSDKENLNENNFTEETTYSTHVKRDGNDKLLIKKFKSMLMERELKGLVLKPEAKKWILSGSITEINKNKLNRMIKRFEAENKFSFTIEDNTNFVSKTLPFKLTRIVSGPYGHVITDTGERLSVGGTIDGYTLKSVGRKKVVFQGKNTIELVW